MSAMGIYVYSQVFAYPQSLVLLLLVLIIVSMKHIYVSFNNSFSF
jgi:hypothetical protein